MMWRDDKRSIPDYSAFIFELGIVIHRQNYELKCEPDM